MKARLPRDVHTETDGLVGFRIHSDSNLTTIQNGPAKPLAPLRVGSRSGICVEGSSTMLYHKLLDELLRLQNWLHHSPAVITLW